MTDHFDWKQGLHIPYVPGLHSMTFDLPVAGGIETLEKSIGLTRVPLLQHNLAQAYLVRTETIPLWGRYHPVAIGKVTQLKPSWYGEGLVQVTIEVVRESVLDFGFSLIDQLDAKLIELLPILPHYDTVNKGSMTDWVMMISNWKSNGFISPSYKQPNKHPDVKVSIDIPFDVMLEKHYSKPIAALMQYFGDYAPHGSGLNYDWHLYFKMVGDSMQCDVTSSWDVMDEVGFERGSVGFGLTARHEGSLKHVWYLSASHIDVDDDDDDRILFANDAEEGVPDDEQDIWMYMVSDFKEVLEDVDMQLEAAGDKFNRESVEKVRFTG